MIGGAERCRLHIAYNLYSWLYRSVHVSGRAGADATLPFAPCRQPLANISGPSAQQSAPARQQPQQHAHSQQQQQQRARREDENSVVVRGTRYTKLECVGRGGSSKVELSTIHNLFSTTSLLLIDQFGIGPGSPYSHSSWYQDL